MGWSNLFVVLGLCFALAGCDGAYYVWVRTHSDPTWRIFGGKKYYSLEECKAVEQMLSGFGAVCLPNGMRP